MEREGDGARLIPEDHPDLQTEPVEILFGEPALLGGLVHPGPEIGRQMHRDRRPRGGFLDPPQASGCRGDRLLLLG